MAELKSRQIGKYQIQAELGRGGFGSVYRAYDPTVGRLVAIKVLTAPGDQNLLTRFKNEAAAAGNLRHKNIVTIYDFGDHEGLPYIVMEFLDGEDLQQIISQSKPLTLLQKVSIMLQVADGLHCAHRSGIVHRDVKPGNIRLLPDGTVKIMDFGIARLVAGVPGGVRLTRQGHVIGTLLYMAPEQVRGGEADFLCDIFAYGITYYELLAGKHPFQGSDPRTVFYRITGEDPEPIRSIVPECPEALEAILNRALSKDRELRYQSLREVQLDSEPLLIELRQERAISLLSEANRLYKGGQLDSALAVLSEVFDLDPGNREARQLRETIQVKLLRRVIEPKIEALLQKGGNQIAERQFQEAIESYEAALRLDRDNAEVKERLGRARELLIISRESARKVADARREFARNNLESALQILPEMLEADPGNPDARQLLQEVRRELDRREKERVYEKKIQHAKELLQSNRFEDALVELNSLGEGENEEASQLAAQIRKSKQTHERQQKCKEELTLACEMLNAGEYEAAIPRLERVMNKYPEEPEATRLFIAAHKKLASRRKSEAVQNLEAKVASLVGSQRFDAALEAANEALREYPAEQRLLEVIRETEIAHEMHRRAEAVGETLAKARASIAEEALEIAVQTLERACAEFPGEEQLTKEISRVRILVEQKERDRAIDELCRQAIACSERHEFDRGLAAIDQAIETHGADERLAGAREIIVHDQSNWARSEAVREALDQSSRQIQEGDPLTALETLEVALARYPAEPRLEAAREAARDAVARARREAAIVAAHLEAGSQLERREFGGAVAGLDDAIEAHGADPRLTTLRDQVIDAQAAWARDETIRHAVAEAKRHLEANDPDAAIQATEAALAQYPDDETLSAEAAAAREAAASKQRNAAIEDVCRSAGILAGREEFGAALEEIARGIAEYGADRRLLELEQETIAAKAAWQRRKDIQKVLEECEQCIARGTPEAALQQLEKALREYAGESQLEAALARARQALDAKIREAAVQKAGRHVRRLIKNREFKKALAAVEQELEKSPGDPRLTELRDQVLAAEEDWNREQVVRQALLAAAELEGRNRAAEALEALRSVLEKYPGEPRLVTAFREIEGSWQRQAGEESLRATLEQSQHLLAEDPHTARRMLEEALAEHPDDSRLTAALEDARRRLEERQREDALLATLEQSRSLLAEDPHAAMRMLEEALAEHPDDPRLSTALDDARRQVEEKQRKKSIDNACLQTRLFLDVREFDPALETIETALQTLGGELRLQQMRETVLASRADFERAEGIRQAVEDAGRYGNQGQLEVAVESLLSATRLFGPAEELTDALVGTKQAIEKKRRQEEIERMCRQAHAELDAGRFDQAARLLEEAERVHGAAPEFADLRRRFDAARAEQERRKAIERAVQEINALLARDSLDQAVKAADAALAQYGGEAGLTAIRAAAVKARDARRKDEAIEKLCEEIRACLKRKGAKAALKMLQQAQKTYGADSRFDQLRAEASRLATTPTAIVATAPLPPAGARRNPWVLRIAAGVGALGVFTAALWWYGFGSASRTVRLAVKASPANASVKVENQTCTNGDCRFDVKPGVYRVEVSADGYQSKIEEARLAVGSDAQAIAVTLKALHPTIQVAANFVEGQVSLDGRTAGPLNDGQFTLEGLAPGKHELRIAGKDGTATLAFHADFAKLPALGLISADGVDAIALGSFANQATVACSVCTGAASLDDQPAHEVTVGDGAFSIGSLSAGTHRLRINTGAGERSVVFETGGGPVINFALTSNRNYGTLVVDTGEDGAAVFIDGHRYPRTTARGQLRMTVEAKEHTLRVAKNGFRVEPAELRATVVKGGQLEARFHFTGEAARLLVSNGMPGATVAVDGSTLGTVAADGSFATQVAPGEHRVEIARDGFVASQASRQFLAGRAVLLSTEAQLSPLTQAKSLPKAPAKSAVPETSQPDAAAQESADWQRVTRNPSPTEVEDFLRKHPGGANAAEAQRVLERLEWNATNRTSKAALQQFLSRHADGSHAQEARSLLTGIENVEAEELAAAQRTKEQAARTANDLRAVSDTLKAFESAYNRRDLAELQRLWNPMPKGTAESYRDQFRQAKELAFHLKPSAAPSPSGDTATAVCTRTLSFTARTGQRPPETSERVRVTLDRAGSEWVIRSIVAF